MRVLLIALCALTLGGCMKSAPYGYVKEDPCISCGETWKFYPNEPGGAQSAVARIAKHCWGPCPK